MSMCRVAAVNRLAEHRYCFVVFLHFLVIWDIWVKRPESRIPLKPVLRGMRDVAVSSISYEQARSNRVCCFPTLYVRCISEEFIFFRNN